MRIFYEDKTINYIDWQEAMWSTYNTPISEVSRLLDVSKEWIKHFLLKEITYVVYHNKFIYTKNKSYELTYINLNELALWIEKMQYLKDKVKW